MNERQADKLANIVGGEAWQSGGGMWLVTAGRTDGKLVVFSGDAVCEYADQDAFDEGRASSTIVLNEDDEAGWVIVDRDGTVFYKDDELEIGWPSEDEARHEARGLASRTGERYFVRPIDE